MAQQGGPDRNVYHVANTHLQAGLQAAQKNDQKALYFYYVSIGKALGIEQGCIDFVRRYLTDFKPLQENRPLGDKQLMFKKDWKNLEGMVANTTLEERVKHAKQFLGRRRIPQKIVRTLHVPNPTVERRPSPAADEKSARPAVIDKAVRLMARRNVACQTDDEGNARHEDVACQTVDELAKRDVDWQIDEKSDVFCRSMGIFANEQAHPRELSGVTLMASRDCEHAVGIKRERDDELESPIVKRAALCSERLESINDGVDDGRRFTKLLVWNLHPKVTDLDIAMIFGSFESYESCRVNYYGDGEPFCTADVVFGDEADALKAKHEFNGKKLDGHCMNIVLMEQEKTEEEKHCNENFFSMFGE